MSQQTIRRGQNAMVQQSRPNVNLSSLGYPSVASLTRYLFVSMPVTGIDGKPVVHAVLSGKVRGTPGPQQYAVQPVAAAWSVDKITWNNQPGVRPQFATRSLGALADGDRVDIDVTALIQQIANGQAHYGWRIATNDEAFFYGFAFEDSWTLTIETSDAPETPTTLEPDDGYVSLQKFTVRTDFTDFGGSTTQAAIQVQVDPNGSGNNSWASMTGTAWDSGQVATTVPELDLSTTSYPGLANGATTKWRVRVKDSDGLWSDPSDWATVSRAVKPTLNITTPSGTVLYDFPPTIAAALSSGVVKGWSVMVTSGTDRTDIRYHSGRQPAPVPDSASFVHTLPARNDDGDLIFLDDAPYQIRVRVWDRTDRVRGGVTDPPYLEVWRTVTFEVDATVAAPTSLVIENPNASPRYTLAWTRTAAPDGWIVMRDGKRLVRLEPSDVSFTGGVYRWVDETAAPNETHTWTVRAVTAGRQGLPRSVTDSAAVEGVWLLSRHGDVVLDGTALQFEYKDRRATYTLPGRPDDVDIVGALEGLSGSYAGSIGYAADRPAEDDVDADRAILRAIRRDPTTPVRLVFGTVSVPVLLRNLSVVPSGDMLPNNRQHDVSFECFQCGEFRN